MVGRLVEQEDRRTSQQQLGQLDAHAPAARKLAGGAREVRTTESQTQQRALDVGFAGVAAEDAIAVVGVVEPVQQLLVLGRAVVGALGYGGRQALYFRLDAQHFVEGLGRLVDQRGGVGNAHLLRKVAYRALAVEGHCPRSGLLLADDSAQQGGLARAVLAHKTYSVLGVYQQRYVVEQRPAAVTYREVV